MMMTFLSLNDTKAFKDMFYWENMTLLKNYVRFVVVEVGFGGYTTTHTVNEFVFGYDDPFLTALKEMEPMLGGDPSVVTTVAFNEPNVTL